MANLNTISAKSKKGYDAMGHRTAKHVYNGSGNLERSTYYVLDASGNTMVVYEREVNQTNQTVTFTLEEKHYLSRALCFGIFGSARLGVLNDSLPMLGSQNTTYNQTLWNHVVGKRTYELSNHLGNVLSVISDKVIPEEVTGALVTVMNDQFETTGDLMSWEADDDQIVSNDPLDSNFSLTVNNGEMTIYSGTGSDLGKIYKAQMFEDGVDYTISFNFSSPSNSLAIFGVFDATGNLVNEATTTGNNAHTFTGNGLIGYIGYMVQPQGTVVLDDIQLTYNQPSSIIYLADIRQSQDYSPFGVTLYGRNFSLSGADGFRFGFNGYEADDELKGDGNSYDFGARTMDPRLGRFLTRDVYECKTPNQSPYSFAINSPIICKDNDGKSAIVVITPGQNGNPGTIKIQAEVILYGSGANLELAKLTEARINKNLSDEIKTLMVNGSLYTVEFEIHVTAQSYSDVWKLANDIDFSSSTIPNGTSPIDYGIDEIDNFIRVEKFNAAAEAKDEGFGVVSQMSPYTLNSTPGTNSGFWITPSIIDDATESTHEFMHGLGLFHWDTDKSLTFPDAMVAQNTPYDDFINLDSKYKNTKDGYILSSGNLKVTTNLLLKAFKASGYTIDDQRGLIINFVKNGEGNDQFDGVLGKADNKIYNEHGTVDKNFNSKDKCRNTSY